jgi:hypothetical protein
MAIASYPVVRTSALRREELSVHAIEKIRPQARFDGEQSDQQQPKSWVCTPLTKPHASQSSTETSDPFWDAPRLKPQFVAQVMGQVYGTAARQASASTAYKTARPAPLLFDQKV